MVPLYLRQLNVSFKRIATGKIKSICSSDCIAHFCGTEVHGCRVAGEFNEADTDLFSASCLILEFDGTLPVRLAACGGNHFLVQRDTAYRERAK